MTVVVRLQISAVILDPVGKIDASADREIEVTPIEQYANGGGF